MILRKKLNYVFSVLMVASFALSTSCQSQHSESSHEHGHEHGNEGSHNEAVEGTHDGDDEDGEESGTQYGIDETYDGIRNGVHMILSFDKARSAFLGTIENVTEKKIKKVRVEVHLSNNVELGPTKAVNLAAGEKQMVTLSAEGQDFKTWSTHAESGSGEHSHEGGNEHDSEGSHEHGEDGGHEHD